MASTAAPVAGEEERGSGAAPSAGGRLSRAVAAIERRPLLALAVLLVASCALLLYMGRGLSFFFDEWDFVTHDYGGGVHSLLQAHVGNISVFPVAVYKVLFHVAGLDHYAVYRLVVIALHLVCGALVYVLASRRVSAVPALLAAALVLFLGAAWEDLLWPFQIGYLLSAAGGLAAWALLEDRRRLAPLAATLCLIVAVGSSSLGIAILVGVAVELAWRQRWREGWIVLVPAGLYLLWYLGYGESQVTHESLTRAPTFAADLAAAAVGAVAGRGLEWGRPLAVLALLLLLRRLAGPYKVSARLASLIAAALALWAVTAAARSTISQPETSRYVYLGAILVVLIGVELLRGVPVSPRACAVAAAVVLACVLGGLTALHSGSVFLRGTSKTVEAELGALQIAAAYAPAAYQPDPHLAPQVRAGPYLHTVHAIGSSPADSPAVLAASDAGSRGAADGVLLALEPPTLSPAPVTGAPGATPPAVLALAGGSQAPARRGCISLVPAANTTMSTVLALSPPGLLLVNRGAAPAAVAVRRFGDAFVGLGGALAPRSAAALAVRSDAVSRPWQVQLSASSPLLACGGRG